MIRANELLSFLETISSTVRYELRPELQSGHAQKSADYLILILDRLVAQVRDADRIAGAQLESWQQLREQFPGASVPAEAEGASLAPSPHEKLERELDAMQRQLQDERGLTELLSGLGAPASTQSQWFRRAVTASEALWDAMEEGVQPPAAKTAVKSAAPQPEQLQARLGAYLASRFPHLPGDAVIAFRIASGGSTKLTALFSLRPNPVMPERLVLRQDVALNMTGTLITEEYPIIDRLYKLGLRVPQPILVEADAGILGGAFMIMTEIADSVPAGSYFAKERAQQPMMIGPQFAREAAAELARLHSATATAEADPAALLHSTLETLEQARQGWKALPTRPPHSFVIDLGFAWLKSHSLPADRPQCLIHGDYGVHNMMARDGHLAGVLDWELAQIGDPAIDLAECRMLMVEDTLPWEEFVAAYLAAGGDPRACDPQAVAYYCVSMFVVKFGLMIAGARDCFISGARTDSLTASVASHSMDRILQYAARALSMATEARKP